MEQLAGVRLGELGDGSERGARVADVYTASGFQFAVLLDRALDIGLASYQGAPLAAHLVAPFAHPAFYEPQGLGWLRTFGGGLVTGCGMNWMGAPAEDNGQALGIHGRLSHIPATNVSTGAEWQGDDYVIWVEGQVREAMLFNYNLLLKRRISTTLTGTSLRIQDEVINDGYRPTEHMMLYHCNFGFPFVSPDSTLSVDSARMVPRDAVAEPGVDQHLQFQDPVPGYDEQVFYHTPRADASGYATARLTNPNLGLSAYVRFRTAELPCLIEWKMMGAGEYVCGLEPGSAWVSGRPAAREAGQVKVLQAGERVSYDLEIGVTPA
ncbi:MAG: aldose 1-epimerase family protein [Chloroflexi bacterium]|nr:aldose 1-epimerase family protein [Chloroflexota bacterium]